MKDENYIMKFGWMYNLLKLNPLQADVYAIIHGFSQDGKSRFNGSLNYLTSTLNVSKNTVLSALRFLESKGLIVKVSEKINNVKYTEYYVDLTKIKGSSEIEPLVQDLNKGSSEIEPLGSSEIEPNNTINNNTSERGARAIDFLKHNYPIAFETWELKHKNQVKNYEKLLQDFNDTVDIEGLQFTDKILFARLNKYFRNWVQIENRPLRVVKDESNLDRPEFKRIG